MSFIREKTIEGLRLGDSFSVSRTFTQQDTVSFANISQDFNPVHLDGRFAREKNFHGLICHGLLVASLLTKIGGEIGWLASEMNFRYRKPVYFGETVECQFIITEIDENNRAKAEAVFRNQKNEIVMEARLSGIVPSLAERRIMAEMMAEKGRASAD